MFIEENNLRCSCICMTHLIPAGEVWIILCNESGGYDGT